MDVCGTCGFDKDLPRGFVILDNNILSYAIYEENVCPECGHQKDGSTIRKSIAIKQSEGNTG
jgi:DNA-directed RNA polymerase subunit RPC12/RpoP